MADTPSVTTRDWVQPQGSLRSWEKSLLRANRPQEKRVVANQRPAGPSAPSSPGMAKPAAPLPPGFNSADPHAVPTHPQVATSMRFDFALPPNLDPLARRHPELPPSSPLAGEESTS